MVNIGEFFISVKETIINLGTFSVAAIILILILLIILMIIEKRLEKRMVTKKDRNNYYLEAISGLGDSDASKELGKINSLAREFFKEKFGIKKSIGYSELKDSFMKEKNKEASEFCSQMNDILYSGNSADKNKNMQLIAALSSIIKKNPIKNAIVFEEKEENPEENKEKVSEV